MEITTNKSVTALVLIMLISFLLFTICIFCYVRKDIEVNFITTMTRVTENTAQGSLEHQVNEIKFLIQVIADSLNGNNIDKYLSPKHHEINSIIPSLINSTMFFKASLVSDLKGGHSYPSKINLGNYTPSERQWYPKYGIRD